MSSADIMQELKDYLVSEYSATDIRILDICDTGKKHPVIEVTVYLVTKEAVTTDHCQSVHRKAEEFLDSHSDFTPQYSLQVSSPGLDRVLKKDCDFQYAAGKEIEIHLRKSINNNYSITGILENYTEDSLFLKTADGSITEFQRSDIKKTNLFFIWGGKKNG